MIHNLTVGLEWSAMKIWEIVAIPVFLWGLAFYFFAYRATPEKRSGWHPDGR
jgi:hypothetical protein